jgi:hypothetical protein
MPPTCCLICFYLPCYLCRLFQEDATSWVFAAFAVYVFCVLCCHYVRHNKPMVHFLYIFQRFSFHFVSVTSNILLSRHSSRNSIIIHLPKSRFTSFLSVIRRETPTLHSPNTSFRPPPASQTSSHAYILQI